MYHLVGYEKANGDVPIEMFLDSLPLKLREKTMRSLSVLEEFGTQLRGDSTRCLRDGIFELRSRFGSDITRIMYFFVAGKTIVLTHGFIKKSQKTPREAIRRALRYKKDGEERFGNVDL